MIDGKLYRIFSEACKKQYANKADLARAVAQEKFTEFSYIRKAERQHMTWGGILEYVSLLSSFEMLNSDVKPYVQPDKLTRSGFDLALGEKVGEYAERTGFSPERIRKAVSELVARNPAQLPTPGTILTMLQIDCRYQTFYRALSVRAFQQSVNIHIKTKQTLIIPDIFRE